VKTRKTMTIERGDKAEMRVKNRGNNDRQEERGTD
jgi:hypothetical protein